MELEKRARHWVDQLNPSLNSALPYVTEEEKQMNKQMYLSQDYFCDMCLTTGKMHNKQRHTESKKHQKLQKEREKLLQDKVKEVEIIE